MPVVNFNSNPKCADGINGLTEPELSQLAMQFRPELAAIIDRCYVAGNSAFQFTDTASTEIAEFLIGNGRELVVAIVAASTRKRVEEVQKTNTLFLLPTLWLVLSRTFEDGASTYDMAETLITKLLESAGKHSAAVAGGRVQ